ncbi:MAG TPA: malto-oligosyltrehalose trehalohydrolase [Gemmatimonadaceae bacterium]|nr:malto-oligosyltrehalose trehalohydrolase [Gemmatimonadaceae bacterium]
MSIGWSLERGATVVPGGVRFSVWAPAVERVRVSIRRGDGASEHELDAVGGGTWETTVETAGAGTRYRFLLDDGPGLPDPCSRFQPEGVHGPSEVVDPAAHEWRDGGWSGIEMADYIIYELHVGTFTEAGTFDAAIEKLPVLKELGVTAIELMPVAEFPGSRNWGYDGVDLYAPHSAYGGPAGLRRLVDAAHGNGLAVILDVVYNHFGPEGNYLPQFGPYLTEYYRTPWGPAVNYDGAHSDAVRRFVVDNALYWLTEYHIDGLRLDAVHGIYDFGARHVLEELTDEVHTQGRHLGRRIKVIAESDLNDPRLIRPAERGGFGMDAQWADDLHHALHATLTGEGSGYYEDFQSGVSDIATALADRFIYAGRYSSHRRRRHGAPATDVPADRFVVCLQNHDQVGNRAAGERISMLVPFERQKLGAALYLLSPYVPMLFMGEEWGETNPFQYFVSHTDPELVEAVRQGRRREFEAFGWGDDVPDPQSEETFRRSRVWWGRAAEPGHAELRALYRDMLHLRGAERAFRPGDARVRVTHDAGRGWIMLELVPSVADAMLVIFNLSDETRDVPLAGSVGSRWSLVLSTADLRYERREERRSSAFAHHSLAPDERRRVPQHGHEAGRVLTVPPSSAAVWRRERI